MATKLALSLIIIIILSTFTVGEVKECEIDTACYFYVATHGTDGILADGDAVPDYRIYEEETGTAVTTGSMALLDDANTVGLYSEAFTPATADGYEAGKSYIIYVNTSVGGDMGATVIPLYIVASGHAVEDVNTNIDDIETDTAAADTANELRTLLTGGTDALSTLTEDSNIGIDLDDTAGTLDAAEIGGDAITAAKIAANAIGASEIAADAITSSELAATAAAEITDDWETQSQADPTGFHVNLMEVASDAITDNGDGILECNIEKIDDSDTAALALEEYWAGIYVESGTAQGGSDTGITLAADEVAVDDYYFNDIIYLVSGTGTGQARRIVDYDGTSKEANITTAWATNPDATTIYMMLPNAGSNVEWVGSSAVTGVADFKATGFSTHSADDAADAVWDEDIVAAHNTADTAGEILDSDTTSGVNVKSIANDAVSAAAIATDAVDADAVADNAIDSGAIAAGAIGASEIDADAVGSSELATSAADEIADEVLKESVDDHQGTANSLAEHINEIQADTSAYDTDAEIASAVWDADATSYQAAGSFGVGMGDSADYDQGLLDMLAYNAADGDVETDLDSAGGTTPAAVWGHATRTLTALDEDDTTIDLDSTTVAGAAATVNNTAVAEAVWNYSMNLSVGNANTTKTAESWQEYANNILYWLFFFGGGN